VFDDAGAMIGSLRVPKDRRLVAVGRSHVYLVASDDDDLQTLERYPMPSFDGTRPARDVPCPLSRCLD